MAYDLSDPAFLRDPTQQLHAMRVQGSLVRVKIPLLGKTLLTTTDAATRLVLKDPDLFTRNNAKNGGKNLAQRFWWLPPFMKPLLVNLVTVDGDEHKRLRSLVDKAFARTEIEALRPQLTDMANGLLDDIDPTQPVDILKQYSRPLPLFAICALLGIPDEERRQVSKWIAPISSTQGFWSLVTALPGLRKLIKHFRADIHRPETAARPGLIGEMIRTQSGADQLSEDELVAMIIALFAAGHDTTVHLITNTIYGLVTTDAVRQELRENPEILPTLIEEFMRFTSPVMFTNPHFVTRDVVFEGVQLKKNDQVSAMLIGANHDPDRHNAPDEIKSQRRPNPHMGFGHGPHVCLGMQLARAEAQIAIERLFTRFPNVTLADATKPVRYTKRTGLHGLEGLDLILSP